MKQHLREMTTSRQGVRDIKCMVGPHRMTDKEGGMEVIHRGRNESEIFHTTCGVLLASKEQRDEME